MITPVIGIAASIWADGEERLFAGGAYVRAVARAGGCPVVLPFTGGEAQAGCHLAVVDGVVLTGGGDVDPWLYGAEPLPGLGRVCPERDEYELTLVRTAGALGRPVLGICRGLQAANVALGGTLLQDVRGRPNGLQHWQESRAEVAGHAVAVKAGTLLHRVLRRETVRTNSFHRQAVDEVAPGLLVCGRAADGVVEAVEDIAGLLLAVQWHPEDMVDSQPAMLELFRWLVNKAAGRG
ncbi:gamma-glutamyl-gamma-aminobutyrate hydrolase family protein [Anaeroselena agilis]|uniref:Gamma-glutamyl-gamma-aminobutyrate hydrolase family protein n=1 Tax=Anaeroselena agilis TaxID=3063788 RepID=A0ABU3P048_9FIRM|nr:gamma-glutamyl-gamma-aminobutyrate hydrolase family protein [Selenomonadales bacterium 4137-cl]